jgi:hypothetical protein
MNKEIVDASTVLEQPIGEQQVRDAYATLQKYKQGKKNLEQRIIENDLWYKLRHWECIRKHNDEVEPTSAYLFNCIANKHADAMDSFPEANILPREIGDKGEAKMLTSIVPVVLDQCDFEKVWSDAWWYKLKTGTGVYGVFWDATKLNGVGDVSIRKVDLLNLFWESGITDIQKSRNLFHIELADNDLLAAEYPQLDGKLGANNKEVANYVYDDTVDTSNKSAVIDWYYKKNVNGKTVLHYCKFVNYEVLFATENEPDFADRGWYDHGKYPYVFDVLFPEEGTPCGYGYVDIGKNVQTYIDRGNQAVMRNMLANANPRFFIRNDGAVNEAEYADTSKAFVHTDGNLGQDSILPMQGKPLNEIYVTVLANKVEELKETTGNRDISTGGTTSGVTAASAIAAMQEAGSKLSRDNNKQAYRAFREMVLMIIELIRQFYALPRYFRILGENGAQEFVSYSNENIAPMSNGGAFGVDDGYRFPLFDVEVGAQKQSPYSKMSQNELALQFFGAGFFNPQLADQALLALDMMDFNRKEFIMEKIAQNGTMFQQLMALQQQVAMMSQAMGMPVAPVVGAPALGGAVAPKAVEDNSVLGGDSEKSAEPKNTKQARERVANATDPT